MTDSPQASGPATTEGDECPDPVTVAQVAWLEKFYDIVFVACVGRFADELGTQPDLRHLLTVIGWLAAMWLSWFLIMMRLNRFPEERWLTRFIVVLQLLATAVAVAAAVSPTTSDNTLGAFASAGISVGVAALYLTIPRSRIRDRRLIRVPVIGSSLLAVVVLAGALAPGAVTATLTGVAWLALFAVVWLYDLPRLARSRPVEPRHAGDRYGQLFLVLMGLSFIKVAFAGVPTTGVSFLGIVLAFAVGFALWTLYVDGVLPLGFPERPRRQQAWLAAQFVLSLAITIVAAAVAVVPVTAQGHVTRSGAALEGGSIAAVLLALACLAASAQRPAAGLVKIRAGAAAVAVALTVAAMVIGRFPDDLYSAALAAVLIVAALADGLARRRSQGPLRNPAGRQHA